MPFFLQGSPPLARGTGLRRYIAAVLPVITPACAGNRSLSSNHEYDSKDHPRLRGEQRAAKCVLQSPQGSPPLARGTELLFSTYLSIHGITPACAGNRYGHSGVIFVLWDHPRLRGEQLYLKHKSALRAGSPPLARGTAIYTALPPATRRITPACAGNSGSANSIFGSAKDHPRLRGEQNLFHRPAPCGAGSPPLARGTGARYSRTTLAPRITPACAGNSLAFFLSSSFHWDHPRLRGEQSIVNWASQCRQGSPPLARGTGGAISKSHKSHRITPACAGNRHIIAVKGFASQDHPRLRGEQ